MTKVNRYIKIFSIIFFMLIGTMTLLGQTSLAGLSGVVVNADYKPVVGLTIGHKWDSTNISSGIGYLAPTDNLGKGMFMFNSQYNFNRLSIGGGISLSGDRFATTKPFAMTTYRIFKRSPVRVGFIFSETRRTIGVMIPLIIKK